MALELMVGTTGLAAGIGRGRAGPVCGVHTAHAQRTRPLAKNVCCFHCLPLLYTLLHPGTFSKGFYTFTTRSSTIDFGVTPVGFDVGTAGRGDGGTLRGSH